MEAEAQHDFVPADQETELAFRRGDRLLIFNYGDSVQWYDAQKGTETGIVPGNYIEVTRTNWYLGRIPRTKAEEILRNKESDGAFIVRLSESSPSDFSLSVKCAGSVQHFRILRDPSTHQFYLWENKRFDSLNQLVDHYRTETVSRSSFITLQDDDTFIVEALYDFEPEDNDRDGGTELGFRKGDLIRVLDQQDDNWWGGRIGNREGYFPKSYVRMPNFVAQSG